MAVIERFGGCCHGDHIFFSTLFVLGLWWCVVREKAKSGIKTVTEVLLTLYIHTTAFYLLHQ